MKQIYRYIITFLVAVVSSAQLMHAQLPYNTTMTKTHYNSSAVVVSNVGDQNSWSSGIRLGQRESWFAGVEWNWDDKYVVIALNTNGIPDKLTFSYSTSGGLATGIDWRVYEGSTSSPTTLAWSEDNGSGSATVSLRRDTRYVKLVYSGNYYGNFKSIKVTERKYISLEATEVKSSNKDNTTTKTLDFGEAFVDQANSTLTFDVYWCNLTSPITLTSSSNKFSLSATSITAGKGKYGSQTITVTYNRNEATDFYTSPATITIKDAGNVKSATVTLKGKTKKRVPVIDTPPAVGAINYGRPLSESTLTGGAAHDPITTSTAVAIDHWAWTTNASKPKCGETYSVTLYPSDTRVYTTATTTVGTNITPIAQTLTWVPLDVKTVDADNRIYQIDGGRRLHAATNGDGEIKYKIVSQYNLNGTADNTIASLLKEDGGRYTNLIMNKPGKVVVEAWAASTCNYNESNHITTTFIMPELINLVEDGVITPECDAIYWGQTLSDANVRGTAVYNVSETVSENVPGHFEWLSPYYQPEVNESPGWDRKVRFVPDDRERFRIVTVDIKVIVKKRNTNITYISCPLWRESSSYTNPFSSNNPESAYNVTFTPNDGVITWDAASQSIVVGAVATEKQYTLKVTQAASAHYNAGSLTVTYWVRKRSEVCLPVVQFKNDYGDGALNPEIYNKMRVSGDGTWCFNTGVEEEEGFLLVANVRNNTHTGMVFGHWKDGFDLTQTLLLKIATRIEPVVTRLYFTGIPDKLSVKSQSESVTTYTRFWTSPVEWDISNLQWQVGQSTDGTSYTDVISKTREGVELNNTVSLSPDARYLEIKYYGNFAGYIPYENFQISLRQQFEQGADRNKVTTLTVPQFGTETHPLQVPQQISFRYYGMGACGGTGERLKVESNNEAFYADMEYITENVGIDSWGEYTLNLRCTDVGKSGHITITPVDAEDNPIRDPHGNLITPLTINVSSASPQITNATKTTQIFDTGTEQFPKGGDLYYGLRKHDFSDCFNSAGQPVFDYLYIFGVTGSSEQKISKRFGDYDFTDPTGYFDPVKEYWLPRFDVPDATHGCNAHTPCFVYRKSGSKYVYDHTTKVHAANFDNIDITGKRVYVSGYCPFAYTGKDMTDGGFMNFTGDNGHVYLQDAIIYARHHNTSGKSTYDEPQELTLYLGNNVFSGNGAVMNFSNATATTIHLAGNSIIQATGGAKVGTITGRSRGIEVPFGVSNFNVPAPAIAFKPSSPHDSWQLTVDNQWADGTLTDGTLILSGSKGGGCIDIGTEHSPEPVIAKIEDEPIVYLTPMADEYMTLLTSPDAVYGGFENTKNVYCRLLMDEKNGQGFSLYGVGNDYSPSADAWTAALPDRSFTAESGQTRMVYFDLGGETRGDLQNTTSFIAGRNTAADRQYMVQRVDADSWQTTTAPFDIHSVYLLEAMPESVLQATGSRTTAINRQNEVLVELLEYLEHDMPEGAKEVSADKSLVVLISNWIGERRDGTTAFDDHYTGDKKDYMQRGLLPLTQYDGTNLWSADWYLYEIDGEQTWELRAEQDGPSRFNAEWKPVKRGAGDALMQKGRVYSWRLPYCSMCGVNDDYDYWSGKWLIFEGRTQRAAIDGKTESDDGMKAASTSAKSASGKGYFAGNTSLSGVRPPVGAFIHDQDPTSETYDCFVPFSGSDITPTTACIFLGVSAPAGMRVSAIKRSGEIVYGEAGSDVATAVANLSGDKSSFVAYSAAAGSLIIETTVATDVRVYGVDGRLVASAVLGAGDTTQFNVASGMYVVGNANGETRKVVVR